VQRRRAAQRRGKQRKAERTLGPVAAVVGVKSDAATTEAEEAVGWQAADQVEIDANLQLGTWKSGDCASPLEKRLCPLILCKI
jgi:hypothetical protein